MLFLDSGLLFGLVLLDPGIMDLPVVLVTVQAVLAKFVLGPGLVLPLLLSLLAFLPH